MSMAIFKLAEKCPYKPAPPAPPTDWAEVDSADICQSLREHLEKMRTPADEEKRLIISWGCDY